MVKRIGRSLIREELPWLVAEVVLLVVIANANPPELWFWLVLLLVILAYRIERFLAGGEGPTG
jgi:1,4-dihydroxy-2-naphthoate octaprenyltransferase